MDLWNFLHVDNVFGHFQLFDREEKYNFLNQLIFELEVFHGQC